eukprot:m.53785 g.53785  ORF g.53785 m.53785 type:complete len:425 (-) comp7483_c0_seq2:196-1470(-)
MVTVRPLAAGELDQWFDLLEAVYLPAYGLPRSYFDRHWTSDPTRNVSDVLVAVQAHPHTVVNSDKGASTDSRNAGATHPGSRDVFVASLRVFRRIVRLGDAEIVVGGVGEVGTLPAFRRRGIASMLLEHALKHMQALGVAVSALHAAPAAAALYTRLGWTAAASPVRSITVMPKEGTGASTAAADFDSNANAVSVYPIDFDDGPTRQRLSDVYSRFTAAAALDGAIVRDSDYWAQWMSEPAEAYEYSNGGRTDRRVMRGWEVRTCHDPLSSTDEHVQGTDGQRDKQSSAGSTVAYLIAKPGGSAPDFGDVSSGAAVQSPAHLSLTVLDFAATDHGAVDMTGAHKGTKDWLRYLLGVAGAAFGQDAKRPILATVPAVLLQSPEDAGAEPAAQWMYRSVGMDDNAVAAAADLAASSRHYVACIDEY